MANVLGRSTLAIELRLQHLGLADQYGKPTKVAQAGKKWTTDEDLYLVTCFNENYLLEDMACANDCTKAEVREHLIDLVGHDHYHEYAPHDDYFNEPQQPTKDKEPMALLIEKVTLINNHRADQMTPESIIGFIKAEQGARNAIEDLGLDASYLGQQYDQHTGNVDKLLKLLDKYHAKAAKA